MSLHGDGSGITSIINIEACEVCLDGKHVMRAHQRIIHTAHQDCARVALSKVDPTVVAELRSIGTRGSADLYSKLVDLFRAGSAGTLTQLDAALQASSVKPARAICHKLKSSAANIGALAFSRRVAQLEQLCIDGDVAGALGLLEGLKAAQPALIAELTNLRAGHAGSAPRG